MDIGTFYALVSGTCFGLVGLWWGVVKSRQDWLKDDRSRSLAAGVYLSFLIPGLMSLFAQLGGESRIFWRLVFIVAAILGIYFTARLMAKTGGAALPGLFGRNRWVVILLYVLILVFAVLPGLATYIGLLPLQLEGIMLCLLILVAHGLTWEFMSAPAPAGTTNRPGD
jgi:hypothetical protein